MCATDFKEDLSMRTEMISVKLFCSPRNGFKADSFLKGCTNLC